MTFIRLEVHMLASTLPIIGDLIREAAHPLVGLASDYNALLDCIGEAHFVLLGEASHGTHEFYQARARITQRLIEEKGFNAIAVEADWPDAYRVNRYVQGDETDSDATQALSGFKRFPAWMWRNADVLDFVGWLRSHNDSKDPTSRVGFYGLDLYSLHASIECVLRYLDDIDATAAQRARKRYACFENFGHDPQAYGYAAGLGLTTSCENQAVMQLMELQSNSLRYSRMDGFVAIERFFDAEQNARVVKDAEEYYRSMFHGSVRSWNLRDEHMAETFDALVTHLGRQHSPAKVVVWAHNSHVGDARATQMGRQGEFNIGQLIRESRGLDCRSIGFTTFAGTVTAASDWDGPAERKRVRPARPDSYEGLLHQTGLEAFSLILKAGSPLARGLEESMLERAIGVVYRPDTELASHYFQATLSRQFDAIVHFDQTRAVEPLESAVEKMMDEPAETFPSGI
jgi:erythromycin esterase-like protein